MGFFALTPEATYGQMSSFDIWQPGHLIMESSLSFLKFKTHTTLYVQLPKSPFSYYKKTGCVLWTNLSFGVASNRERLQRSSHQPLITGNTRISATNSRATYNAIVYI